ncbi:MAG: hypothetical protein OHK0013_39530 [Sandaracinaceae bacterium]
MAKTSWTVLGHRPIEKLSSRVWRVEGDLPNMPLKRVMTVVRMSDGRVLVHNGIALEEAAMREIEAWGPVAFVVVPNAYHRLDAPAYRARYPDARFLCPPGARARVAEVVHDVGLYAELPPDPAVSLALLDGVAEAEGYLRVEDESGVTLVLNDAVFNMPHLPGLQGFVLRHVTCSSGGPRVSRLARLFLVKDRPAFVACLHRLADTPGLARVIVSHHETITDRPSEALRAAAATV